MFGIAIALLVVLVESEWRRFLQLVPLLEAWLGRGVLQVREPACWGWGAVGSSAGASSQAAACRSWGEGRCSVPPLPCSALAWCRAGC